MKKTLEKKLDVVFKRYVRLKETPDGWGSCVSCGVNKPFEDLDGGHFINCKWRSTRWHEDNVHIQCQFCNRFNEGNGPGYTLYMVDRYGRERVDYLLALSRETAKFSDSEGELMIAHYKKKIQDLRS